MKKLILLVLTVVTCCSGVSWAGPFHDCGANPPALSRAAHDNHGSAACGNETDFGTTNETCDSGCSGNLCPFGNWETNEWCDDDGSTRSCHAYGTLNCGNNSIRHYSIDCSAPHSGSFPSVNTSRVSARCSGAGQSQQVQCDCTTPLSTGSCNFY